MPKTSKTILERPTVTGDGFLRLPDVLKIYPVGKSTWWNGVKEGKFPSPVPLGPRIVAWRTRDIRELIDNPPPQRNRPAPPHGRKRHK